MQLKLQLKIIRGKMKQFKQFITEEIASETRQLTDLLVDSIYSEYVKNIIKMICHVWDG